MDSTVYVDTFQTHVAKGTQARNVGARHNHQWCHMWSEDINALHQLAAKIGLKRAWFQNHPTLPHYDLVPTKREAALRLGAQERRLLNYLRKKNQSQK